MAGDGLSVFKGTAVEEVGGDAGGSEGVVADPGGEAGGFGAALDDFEGFAAVQALIGQASASTGQGAEQGSLG